METRTLARIISMALSNLVRASLMAFEAALIFTHYHYTLAMGTSSYLCSLLLFYLPQIIHEAGVFA